MIARKETSSSALFYPVGGSGSVPKCFGSGSGSCSNAHNKNNWKGKCNNVCLLFGSSHEKIRIRIRIKLKKIYIYTVYVMSRNVFEPSNISMIIEIATFTVSEEFPLVQEILQQLRIFSAQLSKISIIFLQCTGENIST